MLTRFYWSKYSHVDGWWLAGHNFSSYFKFTLQEFLIIYVLSCEKGGVRPLYRSRIRHFNVKLECLARVASKNYLLRSLFRLKHRIFRCIRWSIWWLVCATRCLWDNYASGLQHLWRLLISENLRNRLIFFDFFRSLMLFKLFNRSLVQISFRILFSQNF